MLGPNGTGCQMDFHSYVYRSFNISRLLVSCNFAYHLFFIPIPPSQNRESKCKLHAAKYCYSSFPSSRNASCNVLLAGSGTKAES